MSEVNYVKSVMVQGATPKQIAFVQSAVRQKGKGKEK